MPTSTKKEMGNIKILVSISQDSEILINGFI